MHVSVGYSAVAENDTGSWWETARPVRDQGEDDMADRTDEQLIGLMKRGATAAGTIAGQKSLAGSLQAIMDEVQAVGARVDQLAALVAQQEPKGPGA
jgi:hypothetical protein